MPVMFSRMIRTTSSIPRCTRSYRGIPLDDTNTTSAIRTGAITHRIRASPVSIVSVTAMPPSSMIGARIPRVCPARIKFCTL